MQARPEMMVSQRSIVEHPFGNLKQWLFGNGRFLLRQLKGARAEMALAVQAYNLKRAIKVMGAHQLMALMGSKALFSCRLLEKQMPRQVGAFVFDLGRLCFHTVCERIAFFIAVGAGLAHDGVFKGAIAAVLLQRGVSQCTQTASRSSAPRKRPAPGW